MDIINDYSINIGVLLLLLLLFYYISDLII